MADGGEARLGPIYDYVLGGDMTKTKKNQNVTMKEYIDHRFDELKEYMNVRFNHIDVATKLAQENLNLRLEGMNEFRNSMKDQASSFITRAEHNIIISKLDASLSQLREDSAMARGAASQTSVIFAYILTMLAIGIGVAGLVINFMK